MQIIFIFYSRCMCTGGFTSPHHTSATLVQTHLKTPVRDEARETFPLVKLCTYIIQHSEVQTSKCSGIEQRRIYLTNHQQSAATSGFAVQSRSSNFPKPTCKYNLSFPPDHLVQNLWQQLAYPSRDSEKHKQQRAGEENTPGTQTIKDHGWTSKCLYLAYVGASPLPSLYCSTLLLLSCTSSCSSATDCYGAYAESYPSLSPRTRLVRGDSDG